jgi:signal transduction histidine kinase
MDPEEPYAGAERRRWVGRLGAAFFLAGGLLSLVTAPFLPQDANTVGTVAIALAAGAVGGFAWLAPWDRWSRRASLMLVPPAFALIAAANLFGGSDVHSYGIYFVVAFLWLGIAHPPWTSVAAAPFAAVAYVVPLFFLPGNLGSGIASAAVTIPICVLAGEALARGNERLLRTEVALRREHDVARRLEALDAMRETFIRTASHELRTPITICRGHLDVMGRAPTAAKLGKAVDVVVDELDRMGRMVDDMTTITRLSDPAGLRVETVPAEALLRSVQDKAVPLLNGRLHISPAPHGSVRADQDRLTQALLNLLQNAAQHAGEEVPVELRLDGEDLSWRFEVSDRGTGLDDQDPETLFEPFRTGPASSGTGLGLAIVRGIAEAHGGTAGAAAGPVQGATFWMRIPR